MVPRPQSFLLAVLLAFSAALADAPALAQGTDTADRPFPTLAVTGEGEAAIAPDMAVVTLTVLREAETARQALDDANAAMDSVMAAMRNQGIEARDLQTSGFSINPQYVYPPQEPADQAEEAERQPRIVGYEVANSLTVRLRDLGQIGAVLDEAVSLGVNQGGNIFFTNDDPAAALDEARRKAVEDARRRAETLAEAAGVELGDVLRIDENTHRPPPIPMMRTQMAEGFAADASVPIAQGENTYRVTVSMSWEIEQAEE